MGEPLQPAAGGGEDLERTRIKGPQKVCGNCGAGLSPSIVVCPNCGATRALVYQKPGKIALAGQVTGGIMAGGALGMVPVVGFVVGLMIYFNVRKMMPAFSRGLALGMVISTTGIIILILGILHTCATL